MADLEAVAADAVAVGEAMALAVAGAGAVVLYVGQTSMGGWDGVSEESGGLRVAIRPSGVRRLRAVSCGQGHCVVLGHGGEVFAWGSNDHGQTGVGSESDEEPSPREVPGLSGKGVGQLACGAVHTVALCEGGAVLGAGSNRQGQLGLRGVGELRRAGALEWRLRAAVNGAGADAGAAGGEVVLQIVCGAFHTLALTARRSACPSRPARDGPHRRVRGADILGSFRSAGGCVSHSSSASCLPPSLQRSISWRAGAHLA
jgi:hypothetical protein